MCSYCLLQVVVSNQAFLDSLVPLIYYLHKHGCHTSKCQIKRMIYSQFTYCSLWADVLSLLNMGLQCETLQHRASGHVLALCLQLYSKNAKCLHVYDRLLTIKRYIANRTLMDKHMYVFTSALNYTNYNCNKYSCVL